MKRRDQPGYGMGTADLSGGTSQRSPLDRPMFHDLKKDGHDGALSRIAKEITTVTLHDGSKLTPTGPQASDPSHLTFSKINEAIKVTLSDTETGEKITDTEVDHRHTVPTAAWFSGAADKIVIPPSFNVTSGAEQEAHRLPPIAQLIKREVIDETAAIALIKGASREFSNWLRASDQNDITKHPGFRPMLVDTINPRTWDRLERNRRVRHLPARTIITPKSLRIDPNSAIAVRTRGQWFSSKDVIKVLGRSDLDGREITTIELKELMTTSPPFATIGNRQGRSGSSFIYENAAFHGGKAPQAVFIPMTAAQVLTFNLEGHLPIAARVLRDIQTKNADMLGHIASQRIDLGETGDENPTFLGQIASLFNRLRGAS